MKGVTQNFKENIKKYGRQLNSIITINNTTIDSENINNINHSFNTGLFKSVMHVLEIDSNIKIEKDSVLNTKVGVKFDNSDYEYIEYNNYKVTEDPEKQEDTLSYKIIAYDKMVESMIDYDLTITERITLRAYLIKICERLGWNTSNIPASFVNSEKIVSPALHQGIGYTFRDALDEIATLSCSFLFFIGDNFYLKYITETSEIIDEELLSETDVTIGEEYFVNSLVFARAEESDNIYKKDDSSIKINGLHEFRVADNQLLSTNDRVDYIEEMFSYLSTFKFYVYDVKSTGIMYLDIADKFTFNIHGKIYSTIMLNSEVNITQGLEERLYVDKPEESETAYKYADTTDRKINQTYIIVDKQNQTIESVVSNVNEQNNKISRMQQTVDSINSKISDIADITTSQETATGKLVFERINQSEPIHIEIKPLGENISYLYPFEKLFPADDLFIKLRTLRFTNTQTNEVFDYELPDDLLYYDNENYDEFILDYDSLTCYVNKKCTYNNDGEVILLDSEVVKEYDFPHIELTDGDYTVEILKYDEVPYGAFLFVRLMAQNMYTTQFATKAELNSEINQTAKEITSTVSETYETKANATTNYSKLIQTANSLQSQINANDTDISKLNQTATNISSEVSKKVGNNEIISKINQSAEAVTINANKISLSGKTINLTSDNTLIKSNNFNVDKYGNVTCSNAKVTGGSINLQGNSSKLGIFQIKGTGNQLGQYSSDYFGINDGNSDYSEIGIYAYYDRNDNEYSVLQVYSPNGRSVITATGITTPSLTVTGSKNRAVKTDDGSYVLLNAYETATPYFGDIGSNKTNENGYCKIEIESIFKQTIELENYKIFIQECGEGKLYVNKKDGYFEVLGTPNLDFDWEIKAIQKGYATTRLAKYEQRLEEKENGKD